MPEDKAGARDLLNGEEIELFAEDAVVAALISSSFLKWASRSLVLKKAVP